MNRDALWTVPHLTSEMDSLWAVNDEWTNSKCRPQPPHIRLGQAIEWSSGLTTAAWITARLDDAVTHTDHSDDCDYIFLWRGKKNKEINWTISRIYNQRGFSQITLEKFRLTGGARHMP
jgi:hypothetical protein